jgi:hypothetical protein
MRTMLKVLAALVVAAILFVAWRTVVLTSDGEIPWFASERQSTILVGGKPSEGWLHRERKYGQVMIVTRKIFGKRESYFVVLPPTRKSGWVSNCSDWTAPHFPLFPLLDVTCDHPDRMNQSDRRLAFGDGSLSFVADDGSLIEARWK